MKKVILLFCASVLLFACSGSSDESNADASDPILGKWKLVSQTLNDDAVVLPACMLGTYFEFKSMGAKFNAEQRDYDPTALDCTTETINGRWGKTDDTYYLNYGLGNSIRWDEVIISGSTMTTTRTLGSNITVSTWQKQ